MFRQPWGGRRLAAATVPDGGADQGRQAIVTNSPADGETRPGLTAVQTAGRPPGLRSLRATKGSEGSPRGSWSRSDEVGDLLFGVPGRPKTSQIGSPERFRDYLRAVRAPRAGGRRCRAESGRKLAAAAIAAARNAKTERQVMVGSSMVGKSGERSSTRI